MSLTSNFFLLFIFWTGISMCLCHDYSGHLLGDRSFTIAGDRSTASGSFSSSGSAIYERGVSFLYEQDEYDVSWRSNSCCGYRAFKFAQKDSFICNIACR